MTLTETIRQTDQLNEQEFQTLFFHMLQTANTKYNMAFFLNSFMTNRNLLHKNDFEKESNKNLLEQKNKKYSWYGCLQNVNKNSVDLQKTALNYR